MFRSRKNPAYEMTPLCCSLAQLKIRGLESYDQNFIKILVDVIGPSRDGFIVVYEHSSKIYKVWEDSEHPGFDKIRMLHRDHGRNETSVYDYSRPDPGPSTRNIRSNSSSGTNRKGKAVEQHSAHVLGEKQATSQEKIQRDVSNNVRTSTATCQTLEPVFCFKKPSRPLAFEPISQILGSPDECRTLKFLVARCVDNDIFTDDDACSKNTVIVIGIPILGSVEGKMRICGIDNQEQAYDRLMKKIVNAKRAAGRERVVVEVSGY